VTPEEHAVVTSLCDVIREKTHPKGKSFSYRELDRQIGKEGQNWTSKFLKGPDARDFPGVPTLGTLLQLLRVCEVEPAEFFGRAFPKGTTVEKPSREADVVATLERLEARLSRLEQVGTGGDDLPQRRRSAEQPPALEAIEDTVLRALQRVGMQPPEDEAKKGTSGR
jgi:hypothetical protein